MGTERQYHAWTTTTDKDKDTEKDLTTDSAKTRRIRLAHKIGFFLVCSGCLLYLSYLSVHKFAQRATATADKYEHLTETSFPQLTLCPSNPYQRDFLSANNLDNVRQIQFEARWVPSASSFQGTMEDFLTNASIPLEDIFNSAIADTEQSLSGATRLTLDGKTTGNCLLAPIWTVKEYYFNGFCYTLSFPRCVSDLGVLELSLNLKQATDVFIHHEEQFLSPNGRSRVKVKASNRSNQKVVFKIAVTYEVVKLNEATGRCFKFNKDWSFDECLYSQLYDIQMNEVPGCTVPWLPRRDSICTDHERSSKAFRIYQNNRRNQHKICQNPCDFTNVFFGPPVEELQDSSDGTQAELIIYFRRDVKVTSEYFLTSAISMIAEIGGYASLLLGFSLFNITDLSDYFVDKWKKFKNFFYKRDTLKQTILKEDNKF